MTEDTGPAMPAAMLALAERLLASRSVDELERRYIDDVEAVIPMPMRGLYLFPEVASEPARRVTANVSDYFVARYEEVGRAVDPLLARVRERGVAVYSLALMPAERWYASRLYREVTSIHDCLHVIEAPVLSGDEVVGTLNFASGADGASPTDQQVALAAGLGRLVGAAISRVAELERAQDELQRALAGLDAVATAVVTSWPRGAPRLNREATRLLARVDGDPALVYHLIARPSHRAPFLRELPVKLVDGSASILRAYSRDVGDEHDSLVSILELDRPATPAPTFTGTRWAGLTDREREVSELVVEGLTDAEISDRLYLSRHTVSQYVKRVYRKVGVGSRVGLTRLALGLDAAAGTPRREPGETRDP